MFNAVKSLASRWQSLATYVINTRSGTTVLPFSRQKRQSTVAVHMGCLFFWSFGAVGPGSADASQNPLREAALALQAGHYAQAHQRFTTIAERDNHPLAQYTLGLLAENGWNEHPPNKTRACRWFERAAFNGHDKSMIKFGYCLKARTVTLLNRTALKDDATHQESAPTTPTAKSKAKKTRAANGGQSQHESLLSPAYWFEKAADRGYIEALCHLGELYRRGEGVPINTSKALQLCFHAAHSGSSWAQRQVGQHFAAQSHFDFAQAAYWYQRAANNGDAIAAYELAELYVNNPAAMAERFDLKGHNHQDLARIWYEAAASLGHKPAYAKTAILYYKALNANLGKNLDLLQQPHNTSADTAKHAQNVFRAAPTELLAKTYLWLRASHIVHTPIPTPTNSGDTTATILDRKISQSVLAKLKKVLPLVPKTWVPDLELKVTTHFKKYPVSWPKPGPKHQDDQPQPASLALIP